MRTLTPRILLAAAAALTALVIAAAVFLMKGQPRWPERARLVIDNSREQSRMGGCFFAGR